MSTFLKQFKCVEDRQWMGVWGGGHTRETDPTMNGWKAKPVIKERPDVLMIGQPGKPVCATVIRLKDRLDVAVYLETPKEIAEAFKGDRVPDARFVPVADVSGFGLAVIREIQADRTNHDL